MSDYTIAGDESKPEFAEFEKSNRAVNEDPDDFEGWEKLVRLAESLEGGLNRNSSPQAIASTRNVFDRFLAKFPLLFGYWKKYADMEFSIAGTEAAEMVRRLLSARVQSLTVHPGLRARHREHWHLRRPLDQLLRLQGRDQPRSRYHQRVSCLSSAILQQKKTRSTR